MILCKVLIRVEFELIGYSCNRNTDKIWFTRRPRSAQMTSHKQQIALTQQIQTHTLRCLSFRCKPTRLFNIPCDFVLHYITKSIFALQIDITKLSTKCHSKYINLNPIFSPFLATPKSFPFRVENYRKAD